MLKTLTPAEFDALITEIQARPLPSTDTIARLNQLISTLILLVIPDEYTVSVPLTTNRYSIVMLMAAAYYLGRDIGDTTQQAGDTLLRKTLDEMNDANRGTGT